MTASAMRSWDAHPWSPKHQPAHGENIQLLEEVRFRDICGQGQKPRGDLPAKQSEQTEDLPSGND